MMHFQKKRRNNNRHIIESSTDDAPAITDGNEKTRSRLSQKSVT